MLCVLFIFGFHLHGLDESNEMVSFTIFRFLCCIKVIWDHTNAITEKFVNERWFKGIEVNQSSLHGLLITAKKLSRIVLPLTILKRPHNFEFEFTIVVLKPQISVSF